MITTSIQNLRQKIVDLKPDLPPVIQSKNKPLFDGIVNKFKELGDNVISFFTYFNTRRVECLALAKNDLRLPHDKIEEIDKSLESLKTNYPFLTNEIIN